ncbi:MAG: thioredoxin domain-containing protein [Myxococcales bacterium]|nr:thioredoxin domain-containing protein [Myxococcales bacterium]MDD9966779.1 thioredoxin domain-containing protein [Myxococcales bacterium]
MTNSLRWLRLWALCALTSSAAAAVDRYLPASAFCAPTGGCAAVANTEVGRILAPFLPAAGLLGFSAIFWASMARHPTIRRRSLQAGIGAGIVGGALLALQWLEARRFCELCLAADLSALGVAGASALSLRTSTPPSSSWPVSAWTALFVVALGVPPVYAVARPASVPDYVVAREQPGKLNVVEVSDFECPFCRRLHDPLTEVLEPHAERLNFVRMPFPLPGHAHAEPATRAYLCAQAQGQGEPMADALFSRPLATLDHAALAGELGLDQSSFKACLAAPETGARIATMKRTVVEGGLAGLPTVFIGRERIEGFDVRTGAAPYAAAVTRALKGRHPTHRPAPWIALGLLLLGLVTWSSRSFKSRGKKAP